MSYTIEVEEKVEFTVKRKIAVDTLVDINNQKIEKLNWDDFGIDGDIYARKEYITDINYGVNLNKYKFVNGLFAVKVRNAEQAEYLINLATANGIKNDGDGCITRDTFEEYPYYYVLPNPDNMCVLEADDFILWAENNKYDIRCETVEFDEIFCIASQ